MATRTVTWDLEVLTGDKKAYGVVRFQFTGSYTPDKVILAGEQRISSAADGTGSADLFVNETGDIASSYICYLPNSESFSFNVPAGEGSINLSALRSLGAIPGDPQYVTIQAWIQAKIDAGEFGAGEALTQTHTVYVSKAGLDANTGTQVGQPLLTLAAAITKAGELITAGATGVRIEVQDGGTYTEAAQIEIPENVHISAPAASFIGTVAVEANASFIINQHFAPGNNARMAEHAGGSNGAAIYVANISDGRGAAGTLTGVDNIRNVGGGGKNFFVRVGIMYVAADGIGIGDVSSGNAGHIHFLVPDLYLAGNNAVGILGSAQGAGSSNIVGFSDHILEIGSPTGTVGIQMSAAGASVKATAGEIIADTAYTISAGSLYLSCPRIIGTRTGSPTQLMLGTADGAVALPYDNAVSGLAATNVQAAIDELRTLIV